MKNFFKKMKEFFKKMKEFFKKMKEFFKKSLTNYETIIDDPIISNKKRV
jgi:hypothetical protein